MQIPQTAAKSAGAYLVLLVAGAVVALWLAGYFFLLKLRLPMYEATPLTIVRYWLHYGDEPTTRHWLTICMTAGAVIAFGFIGLLFIPVRRALHGDARFAKIAEIKKAGLLGDFGLILGKIGQKFVLLPGQQGAICAAPPRSGKGVGLVQPNLLAWPDSVVVLDIRQEAFRITSGFRAKLGEVYLFNPVDEDGKSMQWNPLSYVSDDPVLRIDDLQKIAGMLSPDPAESDSFWTASCRSLFLGLALYVFETPGLPRTLGELVRQIMHSSHKTRGEHWAKIINDRAEAGVPLSPVCVSALGDFIYTSSNTQSSIRKTFTAKLELWLNPLVDAATSGNSFDLRDLRKKKISLYIGVRPADLDRLQLILNLLFQQIIDLNTTEMPEDNPSLKYQLLLLLDEFTAVGRMPIFAKAISFLGGYNIRPFIIIHGMSQLRATYGVDVAETILTCCAALIVFAPKDQKHANEISESLGDMTVKAKSQSHRVMQAAGGSVTASDHARRLLKPQEVKEIGKENEIIFLENMKPIFCRKVIYWQEKVFMSRKKLEAKVPQISGQVHQRMQPVVNTPPVPLRVRRPNQEPTR
jgi:type IV secretion system protein VirD4